MKMEINIMGNGKIIRNTEKEYLPIVMVKNMKVIF